MKYSYCPKCGKKGFHEISKNFINFEKGTTHHCRFCDMEFMKVVRKGMLVWRGVIPRFISKEVKDD